MPSTERVSVFIEHGAGGNRVPVVLDADGLSDDEMQSIAQDTGLETAFLLRSGRPGIDGRLRYWVPNHEMTMCGHATIGTAWVLSRQAGRSDQMFTFDTLAGLVQAGANVEGGWFEQPEGRVELAAAPLVALEALGLGEDALAGLIENATAPRTKTLVPLRTRRLLDRLDPDQETVRRACDTLGSSGLYPYVVETGSVAHARQFPKSSGYREDPATGVAAAALFFALRSSGALDEDQPLTVHQGAAMGRPSRILVEPTGFSGAPGACRVRGAVHVVG